MESYTILHRTARFCNPYFSFLLFLKKQGQKRQRNAKGTRSKGGGNRQPDEIPPNERQPLATKGIRIVQ